MSVGIRDKNIYSIDTTYSSICRENHVNVSQGRGEDCMRTRQNERGYWRKSWARRSHHRMENTGGKKLKLENFLGEEDIVKAQWLRWFGHVTRRAQTKWIRWRWRTDQGKDVEEDGKTIYGGNVQNWKIRKLKGSGIWKC